MTSLQLLDQLLVKSFDDQKKVSTAKRLRLAAGPASSQLNQYPAEKKSSTSSCRRTTISETVKEKLSIGAAKLLRVGGIGRVFRRAFDVKDGERLLKTFPCRLSTTAGPISGVLFISTEKIAFYSDRSVLEFPSPTTGKKLRFRYKVSIPLRNIKRANQSKSAERPFEKYMRVNTTDDFEFWFIGLLNSTRMLKCLHHAISEI